MRAWWRQVAPPPEFCKQMWETRSARGLIAVYHVVQARGKVNALPLATMKRVVTAIAACMIAAPVLADEGRDFRGDSTHGAARGELGPYLQCVPYAREVSGIQIYGDAHSWWEQAQGRYSVGSTPRVGAVMAFKPHRNMRLGHVAAVSKVLDSRRVLLDHANWSPINGRRGQVEKDVLAVDISPANDWSEVQVWYAPLGGLGKTAWPVEGFIYPDRAAQPSTQIAQTDQPARKATSKRFLSAFADFQ